MIKVIIFDERDSYDRIEFFDSIKEANDFINEEKEKESWGNKSYIFNENHTVISLKQYEESKKSAAQKLKLLGLTDLEILSLYS